MSGQQELTEMRIAYPPILSAYHADDIYNSPLSRFEVLSLYGIG